MKKHETFIEKRALHYEAGPDHERQLTQHMKEAVAVRALRSNYGLRYIDVDTEPGTFPGTWFLVVTAFGKLLET